MKWCISISEKLASGVSEEMQLQTADAPKSRCWVGEPVFINLSEHPVFLGQTRRESTIASWTVREVHSKLAAPQYVASFRIRLNFHGRPLSWGFYFTRPILLAFFWAVRETLN